MIVTYNWLKDFVDFDLSPQELADLLTMVGLEVEGMKPVGSDLDEVVVALVTNKEQHPNADKLSLCQVDTGHEILSIVCGAQNFVSGDKVALARIGAVLPGDFRIKRSKIRGCESFGMLCSEKELGLAEDSAGIMILPAESELGIPVFEALGMKDTVIEIGLTPNRADCLSVIGVAREIAAKLGKQLSYPKISLRENSVDVASLATVRVHAPDLCPRYTARYISGCTIAPSPTWMVNRLAAVGIRSINNVVDITNYVMQEYGHPLHAFDFHQLAEGSVVVRRAADGECFKTLDGQERILTESDLTIRDGNKAVALAGVMGGENSEISDTTRDILLESACFAPTAIRKTAKRLGLHTESSHRFERGADIAVLPSALDRAAALVAEFAGGSVAAGMIDEYPAPVSPRMICVRIDQVAKILGVSIPVDEITKIFTGLEFVVDDVEPGVLAVTVPTFRVDIEREIDLIEEVARLHGYDSIPATMPHVETFSDRPPRHQVLERFVRDGLVSHGFAEIITYSFINPAVYDKILLTADDCRRESIQVLNPLTEDQSVMRTTLLPGLLEVAARNTSFRTLDLQLFEMGRVYRPIVGRELPDEPVYVAGVLSGARNPQSWCSDSAQLDFYDAKGILENIIKQLGIKNVAYESRQPESFYHPGKSCTLFVGEDAIGSCGELHPLIQQNFALESPAYYFELNLELLVALSKGVSSVVPPPRYPDTSRDIAMLVPVAITSAAIIDCISGTNVKEVADIEIFDLYTGSSIPAGFKSIAVRLRYRSSERTLTDDEVTRFHQRVIDNLLKKINVTIR
jgi:phenylalanyl-tRNA synthetase beta chain